MQIAKADVLDELAQFLVGFASGLGRVFGPGASRLLELKGDDVPYAQLKTVPLWIAISEMYDYGLCGIPPRERLIGAGEMLDAGWADAELFVRGLDSLSLFLDEDAVRLPMLALRVVRTAVARHLLDGGTRYTDYQDGDSTRLTVAELALLANMEERSIRNAANPNQSRDTLATENVGGRTLVSVSEAARWLSGRKSFIPTAHPLKAAVKPLNLSSAALSSGAMSKLAAAAAARGLTPDDLVGVLLG